MAGGSAVCKYMAHRMDGKHREGRALKAGYIVVISVFVLVIVAVGYWYFR